jgi:hypothetical protein
MDPINAWVDADELKRLAESLLAPPQKPQTPPDDAGFGGDFIGFASQKMQPSIKSPPSDIPSSPQPYSPHSTLTANAVVSATVHPHPSGVAPTPTPAMAAPSPPINTIALASPFKKMSPATESKPVLETNPQEAFRGRMVNFWNLLRHHLSIKGLFILDKNGVPIFDDSDHGKLYFMARSLANTAKSTPDGMGNIQVRVGSTLTLVVIAVETAFGKMILGLLSENSLAPELYPKITNALHSAIAPPSAP